MEALRFRSVGRPFELVLDSIYSCLFSVSLGSADFFHQLSTPKRFRSYLGHNSDVREAFKRLYLIVIRHFENMKMGMDGKERLNVAMVEVIRNDNGF